MNHHKWIDTSQTYREIWEKLMKSESGYICGNTFGKRYNYCVRNPKCHWDKKPNEENNHHHQWISDHTEELEKDRMYVKDDGCNICIGFSIRHIF